METNTAFSKTMDILDIIFMGKNKDYGAYFLRRIYPSHLKKSLLLGILIFVFLFSLPLLIGLLLGKSIEPDKVAVHVQLVRFQPRKNEVKKPVIPQKSLNKFEQPKSSAKRFVTPVITEDINVTDEPPRIGDIKLNTGNENIQTNTTTYSQPALPDVEEQSVITEEKDYQFVEQMPSFPGGEDALRDYIKTFKIPSIAKEMDMNGKVYISFVVDKSGVIRDVKVIRGIYEIIDQALVQHIKKMPPWKPGKQNGKEVSVMFNLPVKISFQ